MVSVIQLDMPNIEIISQGFLTGGQRMNSIKLERWIPWWGVSPLYRLHHGNGDCIISLWLWFKITFPIWNIWNVNFVKDNYLINVVQFISFHLIKNKKYFLILFLSFDLLYESHDRKETVAMQSVCSAYGIIM